MKKLIVIGMLLMAGCGLGSDGDDADRARIISLDEQVKNGQIDGSTADIPEVVAGGLMLLMGMGTLWATKRGWR